ncbi:MAG: ribosomal protein S18-alanine N-acetyltransferase [Gammaproteobacteria bacterium]|nr:ribosomal protein S18-alanine N-acetyltransferase [Gammaproteobacteria bacterium]MBU1440429.1 ribosomal protein S18-alanine N-acetyltransferase [Gammaproteobacteria bacterium]MBU2284929.1 ribosomal protein S18-alanine N-acetyltransferase [Gammaproteobacteria bacterium]MBU2408924.1 ribosomal protein S18-alanine N-acetyltransferase [Gammaproteobacteria bacterium]
MITEHEITLAQPADALDISELSRDAVEYGLSWRWTQRRVMRSISDLSTNVVVARQQGMLIGFAIMKYGDDDAHVLLFAVRSDKRRAGLGSALLAWLEATARVAGIQRIQLEVRARNPVAMAFYRGHGFREAGVSPGYYENVEDALQMVKDLA